MDAGTEFVNGNGTVNPELENKSKARSRTKLIPQISMKTKKSAVGQESVVNEGLRLGAKAYIVKPFTNEQLVAAVNNA